MLTTKKPFYIAGSLMLLNSFSAASQQSPNVILIYTDDQGALDMNCYGAKDLHTPNMDKLANEGVRFTQFYGAPISSPSRSSLLTGQFTRRSGVWGNVGKDNPLPTEKTTIAETMKENGYSTALIGKWHLGDDEDHSPNKQGFDYFFGHRVGCIDNFSHFFYWSGPNRHDLWRNTDEVFYSGQFFPELNLKEIKNYVHDNRKNPFFLYWATNLPHYPMQGSEKWLDYYKDLPSPRNLYAATISTLDEIIGELIVFLEKEGLRENTIIILQSDNGYSVEERNHYGGGFSGEYRGSKFSLFEGGIRVPSIISWPGKIPQNEVRDQMAMNIDWYPTIEELCGLKKRNSEVDGKSLVPIIQNSKTESQHKTLYFDSGNQWAVRNGDWKLMRNVIDPTNPKSITKADSLYLTNLKIDISESKNLISEYPEKPEELKKLRDEYVRSLK